MSISVDNFQGAWFCSVKQASTAWAELSKLYEWSKTRIADIQRSWPEYTLAWAKVQIMRVFNADPEILDLIAARMGGGAGDDQKAKGLKVIERCGIAESIRANSIVPRKEFKRISDKADSFKGPDDLRAEVDRISEEISAAARKLGGCPQLKPTTRATGDYLKENGQLKVANERLRKENEALRSRVKELEGKLAKMKAQMVAEFDRRISELAK